MTSLLLTSAVFPPSTSGLPHYLSRNYGKAKTRENLKNRNPAPKMKSMRRKKYEHKTRKQRNSPRTLISRSPQREKTQLRKSRSRLRRRWKKRRLRKRSLQWI